MTPLTYARAAALVLAGAMVGCVQYIQPPTEPPASEKLAMVEALYRDATDLYFQLYVTEALGTGRSPGGVALPELRAASQVLAERARERLEDVDPGSLRGEDRRALEVMRSELAGRGGTESEPTGQGSADTDCRYDARALAAAGRDQLTDRITTCYARAAARVVVGADTLDRLGVLARLATEEQSVRRRALFLGLQPVWGSVNGRNTPDSPWRALVALSSERWRRDGSPIDAAAQSLGMDPARVEATLLELLDAWRMATPETLVEPWDWYHQNGAVSRRLGPRVPRRELERLNEAFYVGLGASPRTLGIHYDLEPRDGKTAVAFTQFGGVPRRGPNGPVGADPWVFATYRDGGFGNLVELLHETGHAIHIAAIATRPAFANWPDGDPFTEGLADVPALEAYEGKWQLATLGDSASRADNLREKFGSVMMDVAWALFELRMHADPMRDPNQEWTAITQRYLHIAPHPEWSWWAMRGQLIESPGYMMNYALGAMVAADVRARLREVVG
ncbi:MAG: hypothetical protein JNJ98_10050, partial [Gemmatimonadetes bacterium]|nr:hypothetical protein [Gemmatimonadota bacterium]